MTAARKRAEPAPPKKQPPRARQSKPVAPPPKRPPHRPPFEPTEQQRAEVIRLVLADIEQALIARCLKISPPTLRKAFRNELDLTYATIKAQIIAKVVTKARDGDLKAAIFYLETHGWVRSERLVVADGGIDDAASLTDAEIEARIAKLRGKAVVARKVTS